MKAILLGIERLRVLNTATEGELYQALGYCKDTGSDPILRVDEAPPRAGVPLSALDVVLLAMAPDGTTRRHWQWTLDERHGDALLLAAEVRIRDKVDEGRELLRRLNEGLDALDRDEDPPSLHEGPPDPERRLS